MNATAASLIQDGSFDIGIMHDGFRFCGGTGSTGSVSSTSAPTNMPMCGDEFVLSSGLSSRQVGEPEAVDAGSE
ncbi:hypothetical protein QT199_015410 [Xanthomonas phaseoli pv. phaseoli]|uniref:Uncharacterized protein n=1 Tax=Xanthomonas campestris pv. phaseoli TaxID=317013 RepID=A0AB38DU11_XANCH|nr:MULTISPECIES: hypothetical protein [Xanthomonas]MBO9737434.1 hypothetical protein [Xanthomonas phaseoli pv. phaseoli]MBO9744709.1 hypothetical protein [Xanthomonas phaseoli pv. phaseoli]MDM4801493.1 hypothetical protein [Xanthomonas phaseoli pv. phaseoli]MDM4805345.1 hypothetical protein [Xanthomonas phaseoli pv. phaseoli]MDM4809455.1 hypothetical protein [Xanthomonas phaseoli pv. phaseoli]